MIDFASLLWYDVLIQINHWRLFMTEQRHTKEFLKEMQALSLDRKIQIAAARIMEWYSYYDGNVYVSFSGGKDSTVLLDIARKLFQDIEAVFVDTGLEYPEIKEFVKTFDNVTILRPKMTFKDVIIKYGYPFIGKEVAECVSQCKKYLANTGGYQYRAIRFGIEIPSENKKIIEVEQRGLL